MSISKIHIYFVPGLAASSTIFENLIFPEEIYELHFLEWLLPLTIEESIENYAKRMAAFVTEKNPVLVGVSFGGIMVQEMSKHLKPHKVIIISSIKSMYELPKGLKVIQLTKMYKLFPTKSIASIEEFSKFALGEFAKKRIELYKKYLSVRDENYLNWAIYNVLHWSQTKVIENIVHIHGNKDHVFPIKNIQHCIVVENGTHIMIIVKAKRISKLIMNAI